MIFDLGPIWYAKKSVKMIHSVEKIKFVTKENVSQAVQQIATAKREKNVIIKNVFVLVKMVDIVQKTAIAILMIKFALNCVFLIRIVMVATNVQMGIALCLAANQVNVPILDNTAMSKYQTPYYFSFYSSSFILEHHHFAIWNASLMLIAMMMKNA